MASEVGRVWRRGSVRQILIGQNGVSLEVLGRFEGASYQLGVPVPAI